MEWAATGDHTKIAGTVGPGLPEQPGPPEPVDSASASGCL